MPLHQADKGKPSMDSLSSDGKNSRLTILYLLIGLLSRIHHHVFPTEEWCLTNNNEGKDILQFLLRTNFCLVFKHSLDLH